MPLTTHEQHVLRNSLYITRRLVFFLAESDTLTDVEFEALNAVIEEFMTINRCLRPRRERGHE